MGRWVICALVVVAAAAGGFFAGRNCTPQQVASAPGPALPSDDSPVIAKWVGGRLTAQQMRERVLDQKRAAGLQSLTEEQARGFAEAALRDELLATEAKRRGLEHDPRVDAQVAKALAARLIELEFDDTRKLPEVSEADLAAYYQKHQAELGGLSLEEARPKLASRVWYERRDAAMKKFTDQLRTNLSLTTDDKELGAVVGSLH